MLYMIILWFPLLQSNKSTTFAPAIHWSVMIDGEEVTPTKDYHIARGFSKWTTMNEQMQVLLLYMMLCSGGTES